LARLCSKWMINIECFHKATYDNSTRPGTVKSDRF
jgi:hypothetical protein